MTETAAPPPGLRDAATLLLALGEEPAAQVLKELSAREVQKLGTTMTTIGKRSRDEVSKTLQKCIEQVESQAVGGDSKEYLRSVLTSALGVDKASGLLDRILLGHASKGLETLKWMDARSVAEQVRNEHPQTIAVVLAYLEADHAAEVLMRLSESVRAEIVARIAVLDGVRPSALSELDEVIERQFTGNNAARTAALGGLKSGANILNALDHSVESALLTQIRSEDEALATKLEELMFTFADLLELEDRDMQEVLRTVANDALVPALKAADEPLLAKFLKNMSQRAGEMLKDDIESSGPIKLSDVEAAQKKILIAARQLAADGKISLGAAGEEYV